MQQAPEAARIKNAITFLMAQGYTVERPKPALLSELLTLNDVMHMTSLSKSTLYSMKRAGRFPMPMKIGLAKVRWKRSDIQAWIERLLDSSNS